MAEPHPAKKSAKKAAKKAPGKQDPHRATKDMRRSFEHEGRVRAIAARMQVGDPALPVLLQMAEAASEAGQFKAAAELLRAAEHCVFAALQAEQADKVSSTLRKELRQELDHLRERAREHGDGEESPDALRSMFVQASAGAQEAFDRGAYRTALELARAAEALTHVGVLEGVTLTRVAGSSKSTRSTRPAEKRTKR